MATTKTARTRATVPPVTSSKSRGVVDALAAPPEERVIRVAPTELAIGPNVRKQQDPASYKLLVASISEVGVIEAVTAFLRDDGVYEVVTGQTRTNAAVEAGVADIPVRVIAKPEDHAIVERQLIENTARAPMTRADQVAAARQLAFDFKLPAAQIAKRTTLKVQDVDHALKVATAPAALAGLGREDLPLSLLAELADSGLTEEEAKPVLQARFNADWELKKAIAAKKVRKLVQSETDKLRNAGVMVTHVPPTDSYGVPTKGSVAAWVSTITNPKTKKSFTDKQHESCPGHAIYVGPDSHYGLPETIQTRAVCLDPKANGHATPKASSTSSMSDEERATKKENTRINKAWPAVTEVRLNWIRDNLLNRTKPPAGWQRIVAADLAGEHGTGFSGFRYGSSPYELNRILGLGVEEKPSEYSDRPRVDGDEVEKRLWTYFARRPEHVLLALAIHRHEVTLISRGTWERLSVPYFTWLHEQGYTFTEEEQLVLDRLAKIQKRHIDAIAAVAEAGTGD